MGLVTVCRVGCPVLWSTGSACRLFSLFVGRWLVVRGVAQRESVAISSPSAVCGEDRDS